MLTISSAHCIYAFDAQMAPACWVDPGEVINLEMRDALDGQIQAGMDSLDGVDQVNVNPATGPIGVRGAEPGQALAVDILDIRVAPQGYVTFGGQPRFFGHEGGLVAFSGDIRLAMSPMIGTIGVAPARGRIPNSLPGDHGGNMDVRDVCAGATLYLPIWQPGGLLALGDAHSIQADGESSGQGIEVCAEAMIRVRLLDRQPAAAPVLLRGGELMTIGHGETLDIAAAQAVTAMAGILTSHSALTPAEARVLIGLVGDVRVGQMVCALRTARVALSLAAVAWSPPLVL